MSKGRQDRLAEIRNNSRFDAVVVGGGVNGIGTYRDLALQGLRVLLVERNDFCSGCSAAPSRMIHGGLRYLENGEFGLVRESLEERDALLRNAAHFVRPLPTVIPITSYFSGLTNSAMQFFGGNGKPSSRGALPIKLGLSLYDWVTRKRRALPRHRFNSAAETFRKWPELTPRIRSSAVYYDAWISHPERLCVEMIGDVRETDPASIALNYAELTATGDKYELQCLLTNEVLPIDPMAIVNATGAWLDESVRLLHGEVESEMVGGTKGSHLILNNSELLDALAGHMVYFENTDGRVCIVFPYLGRVLAGATDIRVPRAEKVKCGDEERDYILASLKLVFPNLTVTKDDVVFSFSGIRPLPISDQDFTGRISRGHSVRRIDGPVPQFCMIGGKWTTFRAFAEQTADAVLAELGRERRVGTRELEIGGGKHFPKDPNVLIQELGTRFGIGPGRASHLASRYGTKASDVHTFCVQNGPEKNIDTGSAYTEAEILYLIREEQVETLADIVLRRTSLAISGEVSAAKIDVIARIFARERGLTAAAIAAQRDELTSELEEYYGVGKGLLTERSKDRSRECA